MKLFQRAIAAGLILTLQACCTEPGELCPVGAGAGSSGGNSGTSQGGSASRQPAQPAQPSTVPINPMLDDPEAKREDWEYEIFADSPSQAESKCRQLAEQLTKENKVPVTSRGAKRVRGKQYMCQLTTEVPNE